ncbi:lysozyme inhibitor LprI family protein [Paraclostridium bifermentans]|uniref:lysozyme inhibitor LprI family protein n=1 Tax=Paraclostridium bifermentans TaxID=1490 RepID=UPI00359C4E6D
MRKILPLAISILLLVGCSNSTFEKSVEEAKLAIASQEYEKAEGLFNLALEEKKDDKEIKALQEQTKKIVEAKKFKEEKEYGKAISLCEDIEKIPSESDIVTSQAKKLKEELIKLKNNESKEEENKTDKDVEEEDEKDDNQNVLSAKRELYIQKLNNLELDLESRYANVYANGSNGEMIEAAGEEYHSWDNILNEIYGEIKKYLPENEMNELKTKQRQWITERDKAAEDEKKEFEGGTAAPLAYNSALAEKTKERCYQLVDEYMK